MEPERICKNCLYWKQDAPLFALNGREDRKTGDCRLEPKIIRKREDELCRYWEPKNGTK